MVVVYVNTILKDTVARIVKVKEFVNMVLQKHTVSFVEINIASIKKIVVGVMYVEEAVYVNTK
jgi:hypothetical protein